MLFLAAEGMVVGLRVELNFNPTQPKKTKLLGCANVKHQF
jgi:hypothetical protein